MLFRLRTHFKWVSKIENFRIPLVGWNMSLNRYIKLIRGSRASVIRMMRDCEAALAGGNSILMFPEGTRSPNGRIRPFKTGRLRARKEHTVGHPAHRSRRNRGRPAQARLPAPWSARDPSHRPRRHSANRLRRPLRPRAHPESPRPDRRRSPKLVLWDPAAGVRGHPPSRRPLACAARAALAALAGCLDAGGSHKTDSVGWGSRRWHLHG